MASAEAADSAGKGVTIAVIDSGIDGSTTRSKDVLSLPWTACKSARLVRGPSDDPHGHGTHVAAIIAGQRGRTADARTACGASRPTHF